MSLVPLSSFTSSNVYYHHDLTILRTAAAAAAAVVWNTGVVIFTIAGLCMSSSLLLLCQPLW